jgi:hypothetical protein
LSATTKSIAPFTPRPPLPSSPLPHLLRVDASRFPLHFSSLPEPSRAPLGAQNGAAAPPWLPPTRLPRSPLLRPTSPATEPRNEIPTSHRSSPTRTRCPGVARVAMAMELC